MYMTLHTPYSGNLLREKTFANCRNMGFRGEIFRGLLARTAYCLPSFQKFAEKTFADRYKTAKFALTRPLPPGKSGPAHSARHAYSRETILATCSPDRTEQKVCHRFLSCTVTAHKFMLLLYHS